MQGFHWETSQATLHPFVVYYREEVGGELKSLSVCIISDDREHVTGTVHAFQKAMLEKVKLHLPQLKNIIYFSDGAAGQYKNCKNFINLCFHEKDFGVKAEWNFFATSHGKSPCDGVGGTVKRLVARASLQATTSDHILTPLEMYTWCKEHIPGIHFIFLEKAEVDKHRESLVDRFVSAKTVPGTRSHHRFVPISLSHLAMFRLSSDVYSTTVAASCETDPNIRSSSVPLEKLQPAATYDNCWYIGCVTERSDQHEDVFVKFMQRTSANILSWPRREDKCWIPYTHVLCCLSAPLPSGSSARQYRYDEQTIRDINLHFEAFC